MSVNSTRMKPRGRRRPTCGSSTWPARLVAAAAVVVLATSSGNGSAVGGSVADPSYGRGRGAQEIVVGSSLDDTRRRRGRRLGDGGSRAERQEENARLRLERKAEKQERQRERTEDAEQEDESSNESEAALSVGEYMESRQSELPPPNADGPPEVEEEEVPTTSFAAAFAAKAQKPKVGRLGSPSPTSAPDGEEATAEDAVAGLGRGDDVDDGAPAEDIVFPTDTPYLTSTGGKSSKKSKKSKRPSAGESKSSKGPKGTKSSKSKGGKKSKAGNPTGSPTASASPTASMSPTGQFCQYSGHDPEDVRDGCPEGQFCRLDEGTCLLRIWRWRGTCAPIPDDCDGYDADGTVTFVPPDGEFELMGEHEGQVCGCDGVTYPSTCEAHGVPQNVAYGGACAGTVEPTAEPSYTPTVEPTAEPSYGPTTETKGPSLSPTLSPTVEPTLSPTAEPSLSPTAEPSSSPVNPSTGGPTVVSSREPTM